MEWFCPPSYWENRGNEPFKGPAALSLPSFALPCPKAQSKCIRAPTIMAGPDSSKTNFSFESLTGLLSSMT